MSAIEDAIKTLNKKYGNASIVDGGSEKDSEAFTITSLPTGCVSLDWVLACGGLPRGRIIELIGAESSGKSSMALYLAAQVQKSKGKVVWVDAEYSYSSEYATKLGVDVNSLVVVQPTSGEEAFDVINSLVKTGEVDLVVVDSVAALLPQSELEGEFDKEGMAAQARLMGKGLRILAGTLSRANTTILFINQLREKVGVYYGPKTVSPGGKALKFFASVRLEVRHGKSIKDKDEAVIGNGLIITAVKNKVGLPNRTAEFDLYYASGIDLVSDLFNFGVKMGVIEKKGNTYFVGEEKLGVGEGGAVESLRGRNDLQIVVRDLVVTIKG
jgi:recombination protein RecA